MTQDNSNINRRNFLRLTGITGAGLIMGLSSKASGIEIVENLTNALESYEILPFVVIEKLTGKISE